MDIKIENEDIVLNENGSPVTVSGIEQAVQQVNIALKARAESFVYDRKMGIKDSFDFSENNVEKKIEALLNECLVHTGVYAKVDYIAGGDNITIGLVLNDGYKDYFTEVVVNG